MPMMEDRYDEWRDRLDNDEIAEIMVSRLGSDTVEEMLWEQFIEDEEDRADYEGELQMEMERGN